MRNLPNIQTRCKCGQVSPLRAARVEALLEYLGPGGATTVSWNLYNELCARFDWTRSIADRTLDDAARLGKVHFRQNEWGFEVEVLAGENSQCSAA